MKDTYQMRAGLEEDHGRKQARRKKDYRTALTALPSSASPKMRSYSGPLPAVAYQRRGMAYEKKGDKLEAEKDYAQAKKLERKEP